MTENRTVKRKISLAPIEDPKPPANSETMTEESNIDDYIEAEVNDRKEEFSDSDKTEMVERIIELEKENERLSSELSAARSELEELRTSGGNVESGNREQGNGELAKKLEKMDFENDELILKNSELEFEIVRLKESNNALQSRLDTLELQKSVETPKSAVHRIDTQPTFVNNGYKNWR